MELTHGTLLGGRVRYAQPREGFRSGIEPVLLAAAVPARPGEFVVEAGCGAGAGLLCLAARVPGVRGLGIEQDPALAGLARENVAANGFGGISIVAGDVLRVDLPEADHAFLNPPYYCGHGTLPADPRRMVAKHAVAGEVSRWVGALGGRLRGRGTLTLILSAAALPEALSALASVDCHASALLPLWPKPGRRAKLALLQGVRHGRSRFGLLPGLTLHRPPGGFTAEAEAVLREGAGLDLSGTGELAPRPDVK